MTNANLYYLLKQTESKLNGIKNINSDSHIYTNDRIILVDASSSDINLTIETKKYNNYIIKKIDSSSNQVNIIPSTGLIEGESSITLLSQYSFIEVICDGQNWYIIGSNIYI